MAQADDARVGRACTRRIEGLREAGELLPGLCRAGKDQPVGARVGDDSRAGRIAGFAARQGVGQHFGNVQRPTVLQVDHAEVVTLGAIQLADQIFDARDVGAAIADDQRVCRTDRCKVTVLWNQWPNQRNQLRRGAVLHLDHAGFQQVAAGRAAACLRFRLGVGHDARDVALRQHAEPMSRHHRQEQLVNLRQREGGIGYHAHLAFHAWIDDEGLPGELTDLVDEGADIGIPQIDRPAFLAIGTRLDAWLGSQ